MLRRFKKYAIGAGGMLVLIATLVLATGWGSAAAAQITSVFVTNDASHAVPVRDQNTDANGNIKVHEQATTKLLASGELNSTSNTLVSGLDVSSYREIRVAPGFVACSPSGGQMFLIIEASEGGSPYLIDDVNVCSNPDAALHNLVYDAPGRTLTIRCVCPSDAAMSFAVFGRSN